SAPRSPNLIQKERGGAQPALEATSEKLGMTHDQDESRSDEESKKGFANGSQLGMTHIAPVG
ncbi:MAG TPA: hypothetical protein VHD63_12180, partial [Ktedonobacteraceae bacterium]|nr:hypothetical protein [Ktedonobacteraceae bacterium]